MFKNNKDIFIMGGIVFALLWIGLVFYPNQAANLFGIRAQPSPSVRPSETVKPEFTVPAAQLAKMNSEIFHEIHVTVFIKEPTDRAEFGNWVDTLNQGASFEGVYNGLVHSTSYKKLEETEKAASAQSLQIFGEELALLEAELPEPTQFDSMTATPVPVTSPMPDASPTVKVSSAQLAETYSKQFVGVSIFTLKRILGDEALKVFTTKNQYREKLALWYSKWVSHMVSRGVDFGVPLRNKDDEAFHYKWALDNDEDRLKWEVLNRLHRVLNEVNGR